jgi:hypothetical protein
MLQSRVMLRCSATLALHLPERPRLFVRFRAVAGWAGAPHPNAVFRLCLYYGAVCEVPGGVSEMPCVLGVQGVCLGGLGVKF